MSIYRKQDVGSSRIPFTILRERTRDNPLRFWINPSECQWRIGLRTTIEKIAGGAVHHEWPTLGSIGQPSGTLLDLPQLSLTFQSGNIIPSGYDEIGKSESSNNAVPEGVGNFYDFISLMGQSNILPNGKPNYVNILYMSNVFPQIWLQGFFTEDGVSWVDTSENPNQISSWGVNFIVFNSTPAIEDAEDLRRKFSEVLGFSSIDASNFNRNFKDEIV